MMDKIQYQKAVESKEVLYLIVFKDVFKRIASMEKTTEHRDRTTYWSKRLLNKEYKFIRFSNGYGNDTRPYLLTKYKGYEVNDLKNRYELPIDTILELGNYNE